MEKNFFLLLAISIIDKIRGSTLLFLPFVIPVYTYLYLHVYQCSVVCASFTRLHCTYILVHRCVCVSVHKKGFGAFGFLAVS